VTYEDETLDIHGAARQLGVHEQTVRRLARENGIPAYKVGKVWRFSRQALRRWAETRYERSRSLSVLVVDDDKMIRDLVRRLLEPNGYRVATASGGEEGLRYVSQDTPDLVLLDLKMPGMNGAEFLRRFRQEHADTPVMVVTGYPDSELMSQAMRYGPITLLGKPLETDRLVRSVGLAVNGLLARNNTM